MNELADLLEDFRQPFTAVPDAAGLTAAVGDETSCRVIAAFSRLVLPRWRPPQGQKKPPHAQRARWLWLWSGFPGGPDEPVFLEDLAKRAGVTLRAARRAWPAVMASRLVFPDGSLSEDAMGLLGAFVMTKMPAAARENDAKTKQKERPYVEPGRPPGRVR